VADLEVGADPVARPQCDEVVDHELLSVQFAAHAFADHRHSTWQELVELLGRVLGPMLLHEREPRVDEDDDEDRHPQLPYPRNERQGSGAPEQEREEAGHLVQQLPPGRYAWWRRQPIRAISSEP
jgi:hypothetical protein